MHLTSLALTEFRSVRSLTLEIPAGGFGLVGANAAGKSTLFEAIVLLSTTRSMRAGAERELLNWQSGEDLQVPPFARVEGHFTSLHGDRIIELGLQAEPLRANRVKKIITLDGKRTTAGKVIGALKCVIFEPPDIDLVSGSPRLRRRYLDVLLSQVDPGYLSALSRYSRIVEQRNSLIKNLIRENRPWSDSGVRTQIEYWDSELVAHGSLIVHHRLRALKQLDHFARKRLESFTGGDGMKTVYRPSIGNDDSHEAGSKAFLRSASESVPESAFALSELLKQVRAAEFRRGVTLVGPHRDDLAVSVDGIDVGAFGSRGQQRLAAIALKLAEADLMHAEAKEHPVVLLDDVFSELDRRHRHLLSRSIGELGAQVIVSATDLEAFGETGMTSLPTATIVAGQVVWNLD